VVGVAAGLLILGALISLRFGVTPIRWADLGAIFGFGEDSLAKVILQEVRLPRVLLAALVGAALAGCGAAMQGLFRNPLADPGLIGVSSGGAVGALLVLILSAAWSLPGVLTIWIQPIGALFGALLVAGLAWRLSFRAGRSDVAALLLAGIALNALGAALIGLMLTVADGQQLRSFLYWSLGSFALADGERVRVAAVLVLLPLLLLLPWGRRLDVLQLGEDEAARLGVPVTTLTRFCIALCALSVGSAVALCGIVSFVGLVVPHVIRLLCGPGHRFLLPASALAGAALLVWADAAARWIRAPEELPIGILTALLGTPFFLGLIVYGKAGYRTGR
jgi:iron complex transport system permease protein